MVLSITKHIASQNEKQQLIINILNDEFVIYSICNKIKYIKITIHLFSKVNKMKSEKAIRKEVLLEVAVKMKNF